MHVICLNLFFILFPTRTSVFVQSSLFLMKFSHMWNKSIECHSIELGLQNASDERLLVDIHNAITLNKLNKRAIFFIRFRKEWTCYHVTLQYSLHNIRVAICKWGTNPFWQSLSQSTIIIYWKVIKNRVTECSQSPSNRINMWFVFFPHTKKKHKWFTLFLCICAH